MKQRSKDDAKRRLARISGQVSGITKMVEDERYCVDVLTQVAALRVALEHFGALMLSQHIEECVYGSEPAASQFSDYSRDQRIEEVRTAISRLLK